MKVFVYYNLRLKCFSVKALSGPHKGRVVDHSTTVEVLDATFKVSEAGRRRVLREQRKNVHAGVVGTLRYTHGPLHVGENCTLVEYNPYRFQTFVDSATHAPVHSASRVVLDKINGVRANDAQ